MSHAIIVAALVSALSVLDAGAATAATEVNTCGQIVSGDAFLSADLDCSTYESGDAITVQGKRGMLDLNGYTLTVSPRSIGSAIYCTKRCKVYGDGGSVIGGRWGVAGNESIKVYDLTITDSAMRGVAATRTYVERVTVMNTGREAITGQAKLTVRDSYVANCGGIPDPLSGGLGATSGVMWACRVRVFNSTVRNNFWGGIEAPCQHGALRIEDSVVIGNGTNPECGVTHTCNYDVSAHRLNVRGVLDCGRSFDFNQTDDFCDGYEPITATCDPVLHNWGICTLD